MFSTVEMSRLTMGPSNNLDEVLRLCANLGNVHIKPYSGDVDGITVGRPHPDADGFTMLAKVRSAISTLNSTNKRGPFLLRKSLNHSGLSPKRLTQLQRQLQRRQTQLLKFRSYRKSRDSNQDRPWNSSRTNDRDFRYRCIPW